MAKSKAKAKKAVSRPKINLKEDGLHLNVLCTSVGVMPNGEHHVRFMAVPNDQPEGLWAAGVDGAPGTPPNITLRLDNLTVQPFKAGQRYGLLIGVVED